MADLGNIDNMMLHKLKYSQDEGIPAALNGYGVPAPDLIAYGGIRVEMADPELKTVDGADLNMQLADRINLIKLPNSPANLFFIPSSEFVRPPKDYEYREPNHHDVEMLAECLRVSPNFHRVIVVIRTAIHGRND